jgi:hypothetical protein
VADRKRVYTGTHVTVDYEPDKESIARCAVGPELAGAVMDIATTKALPYAVSISPRSNRNHRHYQDSWAVVPILTGVPPAALVIGEPPMLRVGAALYNTSPHAAAVEWGNAKHPRGHHILQKVLDRLSRASTR